MGKPKNFGGKKHRRGKNQQITSKVDIPDEGQYFGYITKILGGGFVSVTYYIPTIKEDSIEWIQNEKKGKIRGKMMRRVWININDIVLITERGFDDKTIDIISKFTQDNIDYLKKQNIPIPNINNMFNNDILFSNGNEDYNETLEEEDDGAGGATTFGDDGGGGTTLGAGGGAGSFDELEDNDSD
jgi:initiation factor 1A